MTLLSEEDEDYEVHARIAEWMRAHGVGSPEAAAVALSYFLDRHGYAIVPANALDGDRP